MDMIKLRARSLATSGHGVRSVIKARSTKVIVNGKAAVTTIEPGATLSLMKDSTVSLLMASTQRVRL